jgi:NitT/TauT family transport system permease protein
MQISYARSWPQRLYGHLLIPGLVLLGTAVLVQGFAIAAPNHALGLSNILLALLATFGRLWVAYCLALLFAIPMGLAVTHNQYAERLLLPFFDIMQSLPVLAFFPVIIVFFVHWGLYNSAAIFVLFVTMLWSIVFSLVGGLHAIPQEIKFAGTIFGLRNAAYIEKVLLPASIPYLITGSLLAWAAGWNIVIVAEVLHTYLPGSTDSPDLFGIGSVLVNSSAMGQQQTFLLAIVALIVAIALLNLFVWQRLLRYAERYKFE